MNASTILRHGLLMRRRMREAAAAERERERARLAKLPPRRLIVRLGEGRGHDAARLLISAVRNGGYEVKPGSAELLYDVIDRSLTCVVTVPRELVSGLRLGVIRASHGVVSAEWAEHSA